MSLRIVLTASLLVVLGRSAHGHAVINETSAVAGTFTFVTIRVTHGCGTQPTRELRVLIPDGVTRVSPRFDPAWKVEKRMRKLDAPYETETGLEITETVDQVIWSGGALPDGFYGEFQIRALMPDESGRTLWFKTVQICDDGEIRWIETTSRPDQNPYELKEPAPFLKLVAKDAT
jgi:hypothetical protein